MIKSVKKSTEDDDGDGGGGGVVDSGAESVIADEAFGLLLLVLRRAAATFRLIQRQSLWGSTGAAVIGRVRDSLTKVFGYTSSSNHRDSWTENRLYTHALQKTGIESHVSEEV